MNTAQEVLDSMMSFGILPTSGLFEIDDWLLDTYLHVYANLSKKKNEGIETKFRQKKPGNIRYARKCAGVVLQRTLDSRLDKKVIIHDDKLYMNTKSGFVYILSNEAFEGFYKIGMTTDLNKRLSSYQTYDPLRRYKILHNVFVTDRRKAEKKVLENFDVNLVKGEWLETENALLLFHSIAE